MIDLVGPLEPGTCRGATCRRPIAWAKVKSSGRPMILDPEPNPKGNCILDGKIYLPHWTTCPDARSFGRKGADQETK